MTDKVHTLSQLERTLYHKYTKLREAIKCELVITHKKVSSSPSVLTQHNTYLPYRSKESNRHSNHKSLTLLSVLYPLKAHWSTREKVHSV